MFVRILSISFIITMCSSASLEASIDPAWDGPSTSTHQPALLLAGSNSKNRRDNRQEDRGRQDDREERRDCRDEEGAAGKDKRDCKQDARRGENENDEKFDKDDKDKQ